MAAADIARKTFRASGVIAAPDSPGGAVYTLNRTKLATITGLPQGVCGIGDENEAGFNHFHVMMTGGGGQTWTLEVLRFAGSIVDPSEDAPWSTIAAGLAQTAWVTIGSQIGATSAGTILPAGRFYQLRVTASAPNADLRVWIGAEAYDTL